MFTKRKCFNRHSKKVVYTSTNITSKDMVYIGIDTRLAYLKSLVEQMKNFGYISIDQFSICEDKSPIRSLINSRINKFCPYYIKTNSKNRDVIRERVLTYLITKGEKWKTLKRYHDKILIHKNEKSVINRRYTDNYLIEFNKAYNNPKLKHYFEAF